MKPGDHPDFYRFAPPEGASRESTIALDREGRFTHDGQPIDHRKLERALAGWIARHPDDGRLILTNGYDWCYFRVEDAPFIVAAIRRDGASGEPRLLLSDDSEEPLDPTKLSIGDGDVVYARVKSGGFEARFSRFAQTGLAPWLVSDDPPVVRVGDREHALGARPASNV